MSEQLVRGMICRVRARNFRTAVYLGGAGYMGIREKFGDRYLFIEYSGEGFGCSVDEVYAVLGRVPAGMPLGRDSEALFLLLDQFG